MERLCCRVFLWHISARRFAHSKRNLGHVHTKFISQSQTNPGSFWPETRQHFRLRWHQSQEAEASQYRFLCWQLKEKSVGCGRWKTCCYYKFIDEIVTSSSSWTALMVNSWYTVSQLVGCKPKVGHRAAYTYMWTKLSGRNRKSRYCPSSRPLGVNTSSKLTVV